MKQLKEFKKLFGDRLITLIMSAFGFCAALFWRDAIGSMINEFLPQQSTWPYKLISALIVTIIVVFVTFFLTHFLKKEDIKKK